MKNDAQLALKPQSLWQAIRGRRSHNDGSGTKPLKDIDEKPLEIIRYAGPKNAIKAYSRPLV